VHAEISEVRTVSIAPYLKISPLSSFIVGIISADSVNNLYELIDGIWLKLRQHREEMVGGHTIEQLVNIKERKGWQTIDQEYVSGMFTEKSGVSSIKCIKFLELLKKCKRLVSERPYKSYAVTREYTGPDFIKEIFEKDNTIPLMMISPEHFDQQILLSTTATKGNDVDSFSMKWGLLSGKSGGILPKAHFALQRWKDDKWSNLPLTWSGKPTFTPTRSIWNWGHVWFGDAKIPISQDTFHSLIKGKDEPICWNPNIGVFRECKYRLIAFVE
jgi:hypothetical protein